MRFPFFKAYRPVPLKAVLALSAFSIVFILLSPQNSLRAAANPAPTDQTVSITVRANETIAPWNPIWRFFGYDEADYTYMKYGRRLIGQLAHIGPQPVFFRCHNLLTSGPAVPFPKWSATDIYTLNSAGKPVYNWKIVDRIFDTYIRRGAHPFVEVGFMPQALSLHPHPYQQHWTPTNHKPLFTGWSYPPKSYHQFGQLVYHWARHCLHRYGKAEVSRWYWEIWNEPNIPYWHGTLAQYCKLYDYTAAAIRRAIPGARVGGPAVAGTGSPQAVRFLKGFLLHCSLGKNAATGKIGAPLNFVSFHAKGQPKWRSAHVQMGITAELHDLQAGFLTVAGFPRIRHLPIIVSECDPEGLAASPATVTKANRYRYGSIYAAYDAEIFARSLALARKLHVNLRGELTWAFEFENMPMTPAYRTLAMNGVDLPIMNLMRMLAKMHGSQVKAQSTGGLPLNTILRHGVPHGSDVSAVAARGRHQLAVLIWNYADVDTTSSSAMVNLAVSGLPADLHHANFQLYLVGKHHSNAVTLWRKLGSPAHPNPVAYNQLRLAGLLARFGPSVTATVAGGKSSFSFPLRRQDVALAVFRW